jgi:hypothetical protein
MDDGLSHLYDLFIISLYGVLIAAIFAYVWSLINGGNHVAH